MKHSVLRLAAALLAAVVIGALIAPVSLAAEASSAVSVSASSAKIGSQFTVTVKVSGASVGSIQGVLTYDSAVVEFVSGDSCGGGGGTVRMSKWSSTGEGTGSISVTMTFSAKAAGTATLSFTPDEVTNGSLDPIECSGASTKVTVVSPTPLSSNANLSSLKLSAGTLSPAFSANTTSYSATVENSVTKVTVAAVAADKNAKTAISGKDDLAVGANTRVITVTAQNGSTKKYTVRINRKAADGSVPDTPESSEGRVPVGPSVTVNVDGKTMTVLEDLSEITLPDGFAPAEQVLNDTTVLCVKNAAGISLLYLVGEESGFYLYDNENITFTPFSTVLIAGRTYISLVRPRNEAVPVGFSPAKYTFGDVTLSGWQSDRDKDFYLFYLSSSDYAGFFLYDAKEDTAQRYASFRAADTAAPADTARKATGIAAFISDHFLPVCIGVGAIIFALTLALILVAALKGRKPKPARKPKAQQEEGEDFFSDLEGMTFDFVTPTPAKTSNDTSEKKEEE